MCKRMGDGPNSIFELLFSIYCTCGLSTMNDAAHDIQSRLELARIGERTIRVTFGKMDEGA